MTVSLRRRRVTAAAAWLAAGITLLSSCVSPSQRIDALARDLGFRRQIVDGQGFRHVIYQNAPAIPGADLHVYIEGDGRPYLNRFAVAPDPTPRNPVMLRLMALDPAPSIYVGRPCYFGLSHEPGCAVSLWTTGRFSRAVVDSMVAALADTDSIAVAQRIVLMGHSGGATLALLMANRGQSVTAIVTVAGNLDTAAWTAHHGFEPLIESLNPVDQPRLGDEIFQLHIGGAEDRIIPPALTRDAIAALGGGPLHVVSGAGHTCCWERVWPRVLECVQKNADARYCDLR